MTDNTEPTIDENMVIKLILNAELWTICKPYTSNPPVAEQAMIDDLIVYIKALISDQVAKARIDERDNAWKSFYKAYDNGDKAGDYIIKGVMKKVHANNRKFRVECYWCGGVMYRYSNKFKVKHIMCSCWRDEEKRADRIATPKRSKQ